jgi:hypothetical protein
VSAAVAAVAAVLAAGCASGTATGGSSARAQPAAASRHHSPVHHAARRRRARHHRVHVPARRHERGIPGVDMPNPALTPGVALTTSTARVCVRGYSASVRDVPEAEKAAVYARYGVVDVPYAHEVDHLVSLEIGGSNAIANLWPEPYAGRWGARTKDVLEDRLHELVCDGRLGLRSAQRIEARDWVAAYRRYVGGIPAAPAPAGAGRTRSAGGYYASSYPTASTIYCADDPEWRTLSDRYLVHFSTYAQAIARFPAYHLHRAC